MNNKINLTLLTDLYEITMLNGYFKNENNKIAVFDMFFRKNPFNNGYSVMAGLEQVIDYINNLHFDDEDINYLRSLNIFDDYFLSYLKNFKFSGDIYAIEEGRLVFPNEPILKVKAPIGEAQIIETAILNIINHQTLIATKAARIYNTAKNDILLEFGLRRAQGPDASLYGARAAIIGGFNATSNVLAGKLFNIPVSGTHAHSWIMSFQSELEAFEKYAELYPNSCILLVDTYNTLKSGVPNAIKVFKKLFEKNIHPKIYGIRLDSGDISYLSTEARKMLDAEGFTDAIISASNDLDENIIYSLKGQGACINAWGVGTKLITADGCQSLGGVYKLSAIIKDNIPIPKIKISENIEKITNPGDKEIYRITMINTNKIKGDLITLSDEDISPSNPLELFDPKSPWRRTTLQPNSYKIEKLLTPIFLNGKQVYNSPNLNEIQMKFKSELNMLWKESKRLINPQPPFVDLSKKLYNLRNDLYYNHYRGEKND